MAEHTRGADPAFEDETPRLVRGPGEQFPDTRRGASRGHGPDLRRNEGWYGADPSRDPAWVDAPHGLRPWPEEYGAGFRGGLAHRGSDRAFGPGYDRDTPRFQSGVGEWSSYQAAPPDGPYTGIGPKGYRRPDSRVREDVSEILTRHGGIDASDITVEVSDGEVTLAGTVRDRRVKREAERAIEDVPGVIDVFNTLTLQRGRQDG